MNLNMAASMTFSIIFNLKGLAAMKKIILMSLCALSWQTNAGTMGDVVASPGFVPFISGEAAATWNTIKSSTIFGHSPSIKRNAWGGRGAVGLYRAYSEHWAVSGEIGWGYYGNTKSTHSGTAPDGRASVSGSTTSDLYGFDVLAGLIYRVNQFDLFFKAGAMAENRSYNGNISTTITTNGVSGTNNISLTNVQTNVYPEIKVGAIYNINSNLGVSLAYMGVYGNDALSFSSNGTLPNGTTATNLDLSAALQNPTLNSVIFGLVYKFA